VSRSRAARNRGRLQRWLGTVTTGILIVAAGFTLGVVAGLATENGGLVLDYAAGRTEPLFEAGGPAEGAPPSTGVSNGAPTKTVRAGFSVQVGAFGELAAAERLANELQAAGHPCYVTQPSPGETPRYRVRVGPLETRQAAEGVAGELKQQRGLPTWVLEEGAS